MAQELNNNNSNNNNNKENDYDIHRIHGGSTGNIIAGNADTLNEIHNSIKRIFASKDGERVLNYWQSSIIERPLAGDINVNNIYYLAGERNFILKLKRIIHNDKQQ